MCVCVTERDPEEKMERERKAIDEGERKLLGWGRGGRQRALERVC